MSAKMEAFLIRLRPGKSEDCFALYFCRGEGKCTKTKSERMRLSRLNRSCSDCIRGDGPETLAEIQLRIARGDA